MPTAAARAIKFVRDALLPLAVLAGLWQLASGFVGEETLPSFTAVTRALSMWALSAERLDLLGENFLATVFRIYAGLVLGTMLGLAIGFAMARFSAVEDCLNPILAPLYPIPKPALVPLFVMWLGIGHASVIAVIVIGTLLPIVVNTYRGIRAVPLNKIWSARSLGASEARLWRAVLLPGALPQIVNGFRIAHNLAVVIAIAAELVASQKGMGFLIGDFGAAGAYDMMFGMLVVVVLVVAALDRAVVWGTERMLHWHYAAR